MTKIKEKSSAASIDSIVRWLKAMAGSFVLALLAVVLIGYVGRQQDKQQEARQLDNRIVESCHHYNRDQTKDRQASHTKLFSLAEVAGRPIDKSNISPELAARIAKYDTEMAEFYTYRKCDLPCARAATDKNIQDCPPSDNEEGT